MAKIQERYGKLIVDFRYQGTRCRETTNLEATAQNRRLLKKRLEQLEAEITLGTFDYAKYFPKSKRVAQFAVIQQRQIVLSSSTPLFKDFASIWFNEKKIEWRNSYQEKIQIILNNYLIPALGHRCLDQIKKPDLLEFRASLAKVNYGLKQTSLKASRINQIMTPLRMILNDASERYDFVSPYKNIKNLKESRIDVTPFTLQEVQKIISTVRDDFKPYYTVRFFTGMRTSEIDGLRWHNINFQRREIYIKEALVNGELGETKTFGSDRVIQMSERVYQALISQKNMLNNHSEFVFSTREGKPLDYRLINRRIWHPLLRYLG